MALKTKKAHRRAFALAMRVRGYTQAEDKAPRLLVVGVHHHEDRQACIWRKPDSREGRRRRADPVPPVKLECVE